MTDNSLVIKTVLEDGYDLNVYRIPGIVGVQNPTNGPVAADSFILTVLKTNLGGRNTVVQSAQSVTTGAIYTRVNASGTWTTWLRTTFSTSVRRLLTADTTFYVRPDGSNANDGSADTAGSAWATIQYAWDWCSANLDLGGYKCIIKLADGTYTGNFTALAQPPNGSTIIRGNMTTSSLVNVVTSQFNGFHVRNIGPKCALEGVTLKTTRTTGTFMFNAENSGCVWHVYRVDFETNYSQTHLGANNGASVFLTSLESGTASAYAIRGTTLNSHISVTSNARVTDNGGTITVTGTPTMNGRFVLVDAEAMYFGFPTVTGAFTGGTKFRVISGGLIQTFGSGVDFFPGASAGTTETNGQYL